MTHQLDRATELTQRQVIKLSETGETDPMWSDHAMAAELELHGVVQQRCSNRQLAHQIERHNVLMRTIHCVADNLHNVQLRTVSEHLRIIETLLAKDADLARKRTSVHIERTARGVAKVTFQRSRGIMDS